MTKYQQLGSIGENLLNNLVDNNYTKIFTFPNPRTESGAQVADNIIWMNRLVILIEVKTRTEGPATIQNWARNRIEEGVKQIKKNYKRIKNNEHINLHNDYYNVKLDSENVTRIIGLIILVPGEQLEIYPSDYVNNIYKLPLPIHVLTIEDLRNITQEIDTVTDLEWYFHDRYKYINQYHDIVTGHELDAVGHYKANEYKFPESITDFHQSNYWKKYITNFKERIDARDRENLASEWIDNLENIFIEQRGLIYDIPLGLYFAWELGSLPRRFRTIIGQKIETVQDWFLKGHSSRKFAYRNEATGNWMLFYFLRGNTRQVDRELEKLVRLKLIVEVEKNQFEYAVFGFGSKISVLDPPMLMGLVSASFFSDEEISKGNYSDEELLEAQQLFGHRKEQSMKEFPD